MNQENFYLLIYSVWVIVVWEAVKWLGRTLYRGYQWVKERRTQSR